MGVYLDFPEATPVGRNETLTTAKYNDVIYAATHNSYAVAGHGFLFPNQGIDIMNSLRLGVRGLMLDVHWKDSSKTGIALCHRDCAYGLVEIDSVFETITDFLSLYPVNVITILWEIDCVTLHDCIDIKEMWYTVIENSSIIRLSYIPVTYNLSMIKSSYIPDRIYSKIEWPTIGEMVENQVNVVHFSGRNPFNRLYDLSMWNNFVETTFDNFNEHTLDAPCELTARGIDRDNLLIVNHITYMGMISPFVIRHYNTNPYLYNRIVRCEIELNRTANFVVVDHLSHSDLMQVVTCMNSGDALKNTSCENVHDRNALPEISILLLFTTLICCFFITYRIYCCAICTTQNK